MNKQKFVFLSAFFYIVIVVFAQASSVNAQTIPTFPSCINPQGTIKSSYTSGSHGVPGDSRTFTGTDVVYMLSGETLMQCLCPEDGQGIQTNWWNVKNLTEKEVQNLENDGWIFIPNGSAWGLTNDPYLAKNFSYSCIGGSGGSGGSNGSSGGSSSSSGGSNGGAGGSTSQKISDILGLASTGNIASVYFYLISGVTLISLGLILSKKSPTETV